MKLRTIPTPCSLGTAEFAELLKRAGLSVQPPSIRRAHCIKGSYLGIKPNKLPNGRLTWPADAVRNLISGGVQGGKS